MFTQLPPYVRTLAINGVIVGIVNLVFLYLFALTPLKDVPYIGLSRIALIGFDIFMLVRTLKITKGEQKKYFDQVVLGTVMFGLAGIIYGIGTLLLTQVIQPNVLVEQRTRAIEAIDKTDQPEEEKVKARDLYNNALQQPRFSIDQFVGMASNGLIYSLVAAAFLRTKPQKTEETKEKESNVEKK